MLTFRLYCLSLVCFCLTKSMQHYPYEKEIELTDETLLFMHECENSVVIENTNLF